LTTYALLSLRTSYCTLALACIIGAGNAALAQSAGDSMFGGSTANAPSATPSSSASTALPDAPVSQTAMIRGAVKPVDQPLVLPKNFHISYAASRSNVPTKLSYYLGSAFSSRNLVEALLIAGVPNISSPPLRPDGNSFETGWDQYSDEITAWGKQNEVVLRTHAHRFEVGLATAETRQITSNLALPPLDSSFDERMENAAESIVVTRNDFGDRVPNYSKLGGTVLAAYLGKTVYAKQLGAPELDSGHFMMKYIGFSLLGDLATNTARELIRSARAPEMQMYEANGRSTEDSYYPLSMGGKVIYWLHSAYAPRNFLTAGFIASIPNIPKRPVEPEYYNPASWGTYTNYPAANQAYGEAMFAWKTTIENNARQFGRRFGGGLAEVETQDLLQNFAIPELFDMDPRYIPLGNGYSAGQRTEHAFSSLVVGHTDAGNKTVNLPLLGGTVGAAFAAKQFYYPQVGAPELANTSVLMRTVGLNLLADGVVNLMSEFFGHRSY
jgi:hypothetical protein